MRAWAPGVPGIVEALHARFTDHAYPEHTHDAWTLLLVDEGAVRYDLDRHEHGALRPAVTLLPPHVAHTGRPATADGFRKRVLYLDTAVLRRTPHGRRGRPSEPARRPAAGAGRPAARQPGEPLAAESRLALVGDRLRAHLGGAEPAPPPDRLAADLRDLLDAHLVGGLTLRAAADVLHAHPAHLVRRFTAAFGLPPHRYLTGRRIEAARGGCWRGRPISEVAVAVGFHDQAHLHRHFAKLVGTTPARFARQGARWRDDLPR